MVVDDDRSSGEGSERVVEFRKILSHGMADLVSYGNADRDIEQVRLSLSLCLSVSLKSFGIGWVFGEIKLMTFFLNFDGLLFDFKNCGICQHCGLKK